MHKLTRDIWWLSSQRGTPNWQIVCPMLPYASPGLCSWHWLLQNPTSPPCRLAQSDYTKPSTTRSTDWIAFDIPYISYILRISVSSKKCRKKKTTPLSKCARLKGSWLVFQNQCWDDAGMSWLQPDGKILPSTNPYDLQDTKKKTKKHMEPEHLTSSTGHLKGRFLFWHNQLQIPCQVFNANRWHIRPWPWWGRLEAQAAWVYTCDRGPPGPQECNRGKYWFGIPY